MSKHPPQLDQTFVPREPYEKRYCPRCGRVIKYTVPAIELTYIVHDGNDLCVIDNQGDSGPQELVHRG